jgi:hypothetical protein
MNTQTSQSNGFPFVGILTLIFVVAKITGWVNWSWWIVFSPIIIKLFLVFGLFLFALAIGAVVAFLDKSR